MGTIRTSTLRPIFIAHFSPGVILLPFSTLQFCVSWVVENQALQKRVVHPHLYRRKLHPFFQSLRPSRARRLGQLLVPIPTFGLSTPSLTYTLIVSLSCLLFSYPILLCSAFPESTQCPLFSESTLPFLVHSSFPSRFCRKVLLFLTI